MNEKTTPNEFDSPAIIELMGHRRLIGRVRSEEIAGHKFLRIDVPHSDGHVVTQFYSPSSVYCLTPTTEEMVNRMTPLNSTEPVKPYEIADAVPHENEETEFLE